MQERQPLTQYFHSLLMTVVGQAYVAAGYHLLDKPLQQAGGQFRFIKELDTKPDETLYGFIDYQVLVYAENMWVGRMPSRFRVTLIRSDDPAGRQTDHADYVSRTLSELVVSDFGVAILPAADHWWTFNDTDTLGKALAEAGHLVVGYGIPWLAGDLTPDDD